VADSETGVTVKSYSRPSKYQRLTLNLTLLGSNNYDWSNFQLYYTSKKSVSIIPEKISKLRSVEISRPTTVLSVSTSGI